MPRISTFYGIAIYMYYRDHAPPHFHAIYGEEEAVIHIESARVIQGSLPRRAEKMVVEWAELYRMELLQDWDLAQQGHALEKIPPLD